MGCVSSSPTDPWQATRMAQADANKRLSDEYSVGKLLGEGGYGAVHVCTRRADTTELAVKFCKEDAADADVRKEAKLMHVLAHTNVVRCHGVFLHNESLCIVMDKYEGGDLVQGLQLHQRLRGSIDCHRLVHVFSQMASAVQHLHSMSIAHRDIKGDNFLMDRRCITDPMCRIAMADFGTAIEVKPNERLRSHVGTPNFWAPEFYGKSYGLKADIWAMGVTMFGLLDGNFPFKDETAVKRREPRLPPTLPSSCSDYVLKMLQKDESKRSSADDVMCHKWISSCLPKHVAPFCTPDTRNPDWESARKQSPSDVSISSTSASTEANSSGTYSPRSDSDLESTVSTIVSF